MDGYSIKPSKQAIFDDKGELSISLYVGQPLVYTHINDHKSKVNLLSFDDNFLINFEPSFHPYDACINFPFAEITYEGNLLDTFSNNMDGEEKLEKLNEFYGHVFSRKVLVGGQLFIKGFNKATSTQIDLLKAHLVWAYNSAKYKENLLYNSINLQPEPKIKTSDGGELTTTEKLVNWMKNIYQENMIDIISYINPNPISQLKVKTSAFQYFNEKIIKVANYKDKSNLEEWVKDSIYKTRCRKGN